jgi:hypothetical protein
MGRDRTTRIWVNKATSYADAEAFDATYYASMRPEERLDEVQRLRDGHRKLISEKENASRERLRRAVRIVQQT